jgi:hypothetical protein
MQWSKGERCRSTAQHNTRMDNITAQTELKRGTAVVLCEMMGNGAGSETLQR